MDLTSIAQEHTRDRVVAAELFVPNARDYGIDLLALASVFSEWSAISNGGLASLTVWAISSDELHIFRAHQKLLGGIRISERLGVWSLGDIEARSLKSKAGHSPPSIAFQDAAGRYVEMRPIVNSDQARQIASVLAPMDDNAASDASYGEEEASRKAPLRALITFGFMAALVVMILTGVSSTPLKGVALLLGLFELVLAVAVLSKGKEARRQSVLLLTQAATTGASVIVLSAWYFFQS